MVINPPPDLFVKAVWFLSTILLLLIIYYLINIGNNYIPEKKRIRISNSKMLPILFTILIIYLVYVALKKYPVLSDTFFTIILSLILAYIFDPLVNFLESRGMKRIFAVITIYFIILGIIFILAFLVIPRSGREIKRLMTYLPNYITNITNFIDALYIRYYTTIGGLPPLFQGVESVVIENIGKLEGVIINGLSTFLGGIINTFSKIISIVLTPILTFYFLIDKDEFISRIKSLIPKKYKRDVLIVASEVNISVSQFIRGRLIMALYVGIATTILLMILGIDFAIVIGFITFIADIIPYVGPFLGFLPAFLLSLMSSPIKALWLSIFFIVIQWVENNILAPKILGETTGMHPLTILISIITGGAIFGVLGMVLSVPIIALTKILFVFIKHKLKDLKRME